VFRHSHISPIALALILACVQAEAQRPEAINISVAASLRNAMDGIARAYSERHSGVKIVFNFGASGALQQQIEQGASADVFLSASPKQMDELQAKGLVRTSTRKNLLVNQVVLVAPVRAKGPEGFAGLASPAVKLIALGNPASVPAGDYGRQVLQALGLWDKVQVKLYRRRRR